MSGVTRVPPGGKTPAPCWGVSRVSPGIWGPWDWGSAKGTPLLSIPPRSTPLQAQMPSPCSHPAPHHLRPCPHLPSRRAQVSHPISSPPAWLGRGGAVTGVLLWRRSSVEVQPEELGLPGPFGTSALPPWFSWGAEAGGPCASPKPTQPAGCARGAGGWAGRSSRTLRPVPSSGCPHASQGFALSQCVGATGPASRMT